MSDIPYEDSGTPTDHGYESGKLSPRSSVGKIGCFLSIGVLFLLLLIPVTRRCATGAARRNGCINNLRQISLALLNYESVHGTFPPAYTVDEGGNKLHSWRTLILPFMEEEPLYESIDLSKPWDDPANKMARETVVSGFICPASPLEDTFTCYLGVSGRNCIFSGPQARSLSEVTDGCSKTISVVEVGADHAVHWMSPVDASEEIIIAINSNDEMFHEGVFIATFVDGSTQSLFLETPENVRRAMMTIAGNEEIDGSDL